MFIYSLSNKHFCQAYEQKKDYLYFCVFRTVYKHSPSFDDECQTKRKFQNLCCTIFYIGLFDQWWIIWKVWRAKLANKRFFPFIQYYKFDYNLQLLRQQNLLLRTVGLSTNKHTLNNWPGLRMNVNGGHLARVTTEWSVCKKARLNRIMDTVTKGTMQHSVKQIITNNGKIHKVR